MWIINIQTPDAVGHSRARPVALKLEQAHKINVTQPWSDGAYICFHGRAANEGHQWKYEERTKSRRYALALARRFSPAWKCQWSQQRCMKLAYQATRDGDEAKQAKGTDPLNQFTQDLLVSWGATTVSASARPSPSLHPPAFLFARIAHCPFDLSHPL